MTTSEIAARQSAKEAALMFEKRVLAVLTLLTVIGFIVWLVAVSTNYWYVIHSDVGIYVNATQRYLLHRNSGLFSVCRTSFMNMSGQTPLLINKCRYHLIFPTDAEVKSEKAVDPGLLNFTRTEVCFAVITSGLMLMAIFASIYTFANPRYMFKRLAGGLHFISTATVLVVVEVLISMVQYEKANLPITHPTGATFYYGYSFMLAWIVFVIYLSAGLGFIIYSRKKKRKSDEYYDDEDEFGSADEPTIIGR